MKIAYILGVIVLVLAGVGGGFFAGVSYQQTQTQNAAANFARQRAVPATDQTPNAPGQGQGFVVGGAGGFAGNIPCGTGGAANNQNTQNPTRQANQNQNPNQNQTPNPNATPGARNNQRQDQLAQIGNCVAQGTVKSIDGNTVTISTAESVVTVKTDGQTIVNETILGTAADLKVGDRVTVFSRDTGDNPLASAFQVQRGAR